MLEQRHVSHCVTSPPQVFWELRTPVVKVTHFSLLCNNDIPQLLIKVSCVSDVVYGAS